MAIELPTSGAAATVQVSMNHIYMFPLPKLFRQTCNSFPPSNLDMPAYKRQRPYNYYKKAYARKPYLKKPKAIISKGGVGGGANQMVPRAMPPPMEVKTYDIGISATTSAHEGTLPPFISVLPSGNDSIVSGIIPGVSAFTRIGRQIRVVGIVFRAVITADATDPPVPPAPPVYIDGTPTTLDLIWDKQANGAVPLLSQIYNLSAANNISVLPNADFAKRFDFIKRVQTSGRAGIPTALQLVDLSIKTNRLVNFDAAALGVGSVETNNLLLMFSSCAVGSSITGNIRILYVDA